MKKHLTFLLLTISITIFGQNVGINTADPKRNLEINGNLKIRNLEDKSNNSDFTHLLVIDSQGNVDKIQIPALEQNEINNVEVTRTIYLQNEADVNKECSCGDITIRLNGSTPQIKLNSTTPFTSQNISSFSTGFGVKSWSGTSYNYYDRTGASDGFNFSINDYSTFKNIDKTTAFENNNTIKIYTILLPGQNNLYRVTISRLQNTSNTNIFSLLCEKFYTQFI